MYLQEQILYTAPHTLRVLTIKYFLIEKIFITIFMTLNSFHVVLLKGIYKYVNNFLLLFSKEISIKTSISCQFLKLTTSPKLLYIL